VRRCVCGCRIDLSIVSDPVSKYLFISASSARSLLHHLDVEALDLPASGFRSRHFDAFGGLVESQASSQKVHQPLNLPWPIGSHHTGCRQGFSLISSLTREFAPRGHLIDHAASALVLLALSTPALWGCTPRPRRTARCAVSTPASAPLRREIPCPRVDQVIWWSPHHSRGRGSDRNAALLLLHM
jgi:hypothetical protein